MKILIKKRTDYYDWKIVVVPDWWTYSEIREWLLQEHPGYGFFGDSFPASQYSYSGAIAKGGRLS